MAIDNKTLGIIALFSLLLLFPAFLLGSGGFDLHCQGIWVKNFSEQLWNGELYPRWLMNMYAGNGSPVFFYYPPFVYYITALFYKIVPQDIFSYPAMVCSVFLATFLSGITFFCWIRREVSKEAALVGSLLYMVLPIHVGLNFYIILLHSTVWAYVWLPLMLISARMIAEEKLQAVYAFAICLCLMIITNIPSTVICGPLAVAYGMYYANRQRFSRVLLSLAGAVLLGFGLSMMFLLPSLAYMNYAMLELHWHTIPMHLLRFRWGDRDQLTCTLFWTVQAGLLILYRSYTVDNPGRLRAFLLYVSAFILFMASGLSEWLWGHVLILRILQEPARLYMITVLAIAVLASFAPTKYQKISFLLIVFSVLATYQMAAISRNSEQNFATNRPVDFGHYKLGIDQYVMYLGYSELVHKYYDKENLDSLKHILEARVIEGDARVHIVKWTPRDIVFHYNAGKDSLVMIRQHFFPGWYAITAEGIPLETLWDRPSGQVKVKLPKGSNEVELKLTPLWPESLGKLVTIISMCLVLLLVLVDMRRQEAATMLINK